MKFIFIILAIAIVFLLLNRTGSKKNLNNPRLTQDLAEPEKWSEVQTLLEENTLPSIKIRLLDEKPTSIEQSKFGGVPYWPKDKTYPRGTNGKLLTFIAQINFAEVPGLLEHYPKKGLLQFFVGNDDVWGLEFLSNKNPLEAYLNKAQKDFAVVYHADTQGAVEDFEQEISESFKSNMSPYSGESAIGFSKVEDVASPVDYRFDKIIQPFGRLNDELEEHAYESLMKTPDHKIGGFASFTQEDPRGYYAPDEEWLLLFQMDTDSNSNIDIMWGDAGIANFFIRPDDLKSLDFSKVWYNWDCH